MIIEYLNNSHWVLLVNRIMPMLAILAIFVAFFSRKWSTSGKLISTMLVFKIISWLLLVWADWGSKVFHPSFQTVTARIFIFLNVILFLIFVYMVTRELFELRQENKFLKYELSKHRTAN